MADLSHLNAKNEGQMVDVAAKQVTERVAVVEGRVTLCDGRLSTVTSDMATEIIRTARIAGIQAAKQTSNLIPYCHNIALAQVVIKIEFDGKGFALSTETKTNAQTGVEMEALVGCQLAASTIYDMIKAAYPLATVGPFTLTKKSGGKSNMADGSLQ